MAGFGVPIVNTKPSRFLSLNWSAVSPYGRKIGSIFLIIQSVKIKNLSAIYFIAASTGSNGDFLPLKSSIDLMPLSLPATT